MEKEERMQNERRKGKMRTEETKMKRERYLRCEKRRETRKDYLRPK